MRGLDGKVAIVTGSSQAMGATIAARLAEEGVAVVGASRNADDGEAQAAEIRDRGGRAQYVRCDVTVEDDIRQAVTTATESFGRLDIVVNNAAAIDVIEGGAEKAVVDEPLEIFDQIMKVGIYGPFLLSKYAIPEMLKQGGGSFVNVSSGSAHRPFPGITAYSVSKSALEALTRQIALDYGKQGIRANSLLVGGIRTPTNELLYEHPVVGPIFREVVMVDRDGRPSDVAAMTAFLASDDAAFITAALIPVDGGSTTKLHVPDLSAIFAEAAEATES